MEAIKEHDIVVLQRDLPEHDLTLGEIGAVVHRLRSCMSVSGQHAFKRKSEETLVAKQ